MPNDTLEEKVNDLIEIVGYIKDNMATKDDLAAVENRLEQKIEDFKNEVTGELRLIRSELEEIKVSLRELEQRTREDADATAKEVLALRVRVEALEQQVKKMELTPS